MEYKIKHLFYVPFTGLGLYNGFRGNRWLRNRIKIFKQFVVPSLLAQTNQNFILWISWRPQEKHNRYVKELKHWLDQTSLQVYFSYNGLCIYDDKLPLLEAREKLITSLHSTLGELNDLLDCTHVYVTLQPSDDCYSKYTVEWLQKSFAELECNAIGFKHGYIMNYLTKDVAEYNPSTNPPFYTIKYPRDVFIDPLKHLDYIALKSDQGPYPAGTPLPSHEYPKDCFKYAVSEERGFLVGCHSENISTTFNHTFKGKLVDKETLQKFGLQNVPHLQIPVNLRRLFLHRLPARVQRKLRYYFGELMYNKIHAFFH